MTDSSIPTNDNAEKNAEKSAEVFKVEAQEEGDLRYGWGSWKPKCIQFCNQPLVLLLVMCTAAFIQGVVVNGFVSVSLTNLEKRFFLTGTQTGVIAGAYDMGVVLVLIPVCHFGGFANKAKFMGFGMMLLALGSFLFGLPHFLVRPYEYEALLEGSNETIAPTVCGEGTHLTEFFCRDSHLANYFYMFFVAMLLLGVGASPLYTLGVTLIDETVSQKNSSMYLGIYYSTSVIGPAFGYIIGGQTLNTYGEIGRVDTSTVSIGPDDPRWYGAWWIGPFWASAIAFIISIPLVGYPKRLPGSRERKLQDKNEMHNALSDRVQEATSPGFGKSIAELPKSFKLIFLNFTYVFLTMTESLDGFLLGGFVAFAPKYVEYQFSLSASQAGTLSGGLIVMAAAMGTATGGYLMKRWELTCAGAIKLAIVSLSLSLAMCFGLLLKCQTVDFAGINEKLDYFSISDQGQLVGSCNADCNCTLADYRPLCFEEKSVMFYSPCYAGCTEQAGKNFTNCGCLDELWSAPEAVLVEGKCANDCKNLVPFLLCFTLIAFFTLCASIPSLTAVLRALPANVRSIGVGVQWLFARILGTIPGPIVFGVVFDTACEIFQENCGKRTCRLYNNDRMSWLFLLVAMTVKTGSILACILAYLAYRPPPEPEGAKPDEGVVAVVNGRQNLAFVEDGPAARSDEHTSGAGGSPRSPASVAETIFCVENPMFPPSSRHSSSGYAESTKL